MNVHPPLVRESAEELVRAHFGRWTGRLAWTALAVHGPALAWWALSSAVGSWHWYLLVVANLSLSTLFVMWRSRLGYRRALALVLARRGEQGVRRFVADGSGRGPDCVVEKAERLTPG